jgi:hypothetical protein
VLAERSAGNLHVAAKKGIRRTVSKKQQTLKAATTTKLTTREKKITSHKIKSPERSEQAHKRKRRKIYKQTREESKQITKS